MPDPARLTTVAALPVIPMARLPKDVVTDRVDDPVETKRPVERLLAPVAKVP